MENRRDGKPQFYFHVKKGPKKAYKSLLLPVR